MSSHLPHMRGGVSSRRIVTGRTPRSSPHAWGCFQLVADRADPTEIFPTCVGVFPLRGLPFGMFAHLPHMRGGVSMGRNRIVIVILSSPHVWGVSREKLH